MDIQAASSSALYIILIVLIIILALSVFGFGLYQYLQHRRYKEFKCYVYEKDGLGNVQCWIDQAGIFVDPKTHNKRFFMKKANVGLETDNVPYIKMPNGEKQVMIARTGLKNFSFIKLNIEVNKVNVSVGEEDVNWAINSYERAKKLFTQSLLMQLLPFIALAFVSIIILVIFIYFFKDFTVLKDVAISLKETAQALQQVQGGSAIIQ
jgi:hypothetical protein